MDTKRVLRKLLNAVFVFTITTLTTLTITLPHAHALTNLEKDPLRQKVSASEEFTTETHICGDGHIDLGPRIIDGKWQLAIRDDSKETPLWSLPENTVFTVSDKALLTAPDSGDYAFTGATSGSAVHVIPQTQIPSVPWLGWNTQSPEVIDTIEGGVTLRFLGAQGPGKVTVYLEAGNLSKPTVLFESTKPQAQDVWVEPNTHTHANWVFTRPGIYLINMEAKAKSNDGQELTSTHILRFAIGDQADPAAALAATWNGQQNLKPTDDSNTHQTNSKENPVFGGIGIWGFIFGGAILVAVQLWRAKRAKEQRQQVINHRKAQNSVTEPTNPGNK